MSETRRGTGGNRFIEADADLPELMWAIRDGLYELRDYAKDAGRGFDLAEVSVSTRRVGSGRISVMVSADLTTTATPALAHEAEERL